ncbi:MAG: hypothetical protein DRN71_01790 [Candidatus Nanohalarchaeota archaeon]|nr:MAG: hypothetical protein DRN71_01790 [Candidatus Nanohaloarchaeota archaeon]
MSTFTTSKTTIIKYIIHPKYTHGKKTKKGQHQHPYASSIKHVLNGYNVSHYKDSSDNCSPNPVDFPKIPYCLIDTSGHNNLQIRPACAKRPSPCPLLGRARTNWSLPDVCKKVKGTTGRKLLEMFPQIKKTYFWGSGLWSQTKYFYSIGRDRTSVQRYVGKQRYFKKGLFKRTLPASQSTLSNFAV